MVNQSHPVVLPPAYELHWYRIESVLGQGAFGITYLAHDVNLDRQVAIKEYLPGQFAIRKSDLTVCPTSDQHKEDFEWGLKRFISEAKILTKFEHPNLVRVFNVFEMNNTAYMVMNYEVGKSLQQILKSTKTLSESELIKIIIPLLSGLEVMHEKGFVHRDIKPGNIFIRSDGNPVLLDFGSARQTRGERGKQGSEEEQTVTTLVSPGYAPIEQYGSSGNRQGPWTDIYGLGATLYKAVTGRMPLAAVDRSELITHDMKDGYLPVSDMKGDRYSERFLAAIDHALAFRANERPQDVAEWCADFGITKDDIPTAPVPDPQSVSADVATVKLDSSLGPTTVKMEGEPQQKTEQITEKIEVTEKMNPSRPFYLQGKWLAAIVSAIVLILFAFISLPDKTEPVAEKEIEPVQIPQLPADVEADKQAESILEEVVAPSSEEQEKIEELLALAEEDIAALRLTQPKDNNALTKYRAVLEIDEDNMQAQEGIHMIVDKYIALAYGAMQSGKLSKAESYIEKAKSIYSESNKIEPARNALRKKYLQQDAAATEQADKSASEQFQGETNQDAGAEDEEPEGIWDSLKKWSEPDPNAQPKDSETDKNIKKHFNL